jgi:protocatechuate 3,4-dioxygenase, beta subunit
MKLIYPSRRAFLGQMAFGAAALYVPGVFAEELARTPPQMEGPFYPDKLPLDTDNDLLIINDRINPAVGEIAHLGGKILDANGEPVRNAVVEIWQCDAHGNYIHSNGASSDKRDGNFQGFGRFLTGSNGEYYFRTIKPVPYPGRTPHIHVQVTPKGGEKFTTQCYIKGEALNERDGVLRRTPAKDRELLMVDFKPLKQSKIAELAGRFDVVLGHTPEA